MYKVFVGDKLIVLATYAEKEHGFKNYSLKKSNVKKGLKKLNKKSIKGIRLIHESPDKLLEIFLKQLPNVVAGGGKVYNNQGEVLFILRNDKWDLPKGKAEGDETIEETALREVTEETGVNGLKITKALDTTYHVFKRNGKYKIKITYWFEMKTIFKGEFYAQEDEGITKVAWLNDKQIEIALQHSYGNIKLLM